MIPKFNSKKKSYHLVKGSRLTTLENSLSPHEKVLTFFKKLTANSPSKSNSKLESLFKFVLSMVELISMKFKTYPKNIFKKICFIKMNIKIDFFLKIIKFTHFNNLLNLHKKKLYIRSFHVETNRMIPKCIIIS